MMGKEDVSSNPRYIYVNDKFLMTDGEFVENPFFNKYRVTRVVGYMMANPERVKGMIWRIMRESGYRRYVGQTIDDIYGYTMDFHSQRLTTEFRPNYFNDDSYKIEQYIWKALRQGVQSYNQRKLLNKKTQEDNIVDSEEEEFYHSNTTTGRTLVAMELETSRTELDYFYECFDYLMAIVSNTKPSHAKMKGELVYDVFLGSFNQVKIRRQITRVEGFFELNDEYYEYIHSEYGLTERQVKLWMDRIKESEDLEPFVEMVKELITPIYEGNFVRGDVVGFKLGN